jgi:hypothetical protein
VTVPATASTAISHLLAGGGRGRVLGSSTHAVWVSAGSGVVVVSTRDATRLPNGVEIGAPASSRPFAHVVPDGEVKLAATRLVLESLVVEIVRRWEPRPALPATSRSALARRIRGLPSGVAGVAPEPLRTAIRQARGSELLEAARDILGRGPGLTPEADDYLAGALAAVALLGRGVGRGAATAMLEEVAGPLVALAERRTTDLSATLLGHALRGEVSAPAAAFVRALAGRGDVNATHARLSAVGHSSGPALSAGTVLGALALVGGGGS